MMTKDEIDERRERSNKRTGKQEFEKGMKYRNGDGVPEDLERAFEHFEFAAACGHWQSMTQMGEMYGRGLGIDPYDGSPSADMAYCHFWMREGIKRAETKGQKAPGMDRVPNEKIRTFKVGSIERHARNMLTALLNLEPHD